MTDDEFRREMFEAIKRPPFEQHAREILDSLRDTLDCVVGWVASRIRVW